VTRLEGRTAIVTGASKGIGRAIAERFAAEGAAVVVNSRSAERAAAAADGIEDAVGVAADVSQYDGVAALVDAAVERFGRLDVMVNNAGITTIAPAEGFDHETFREVIDVDLVGVFFGSKLAARAMIDRGEGGAILDVSSMMGDMGFAGRAAYCAAKGGVNNLTRTLAVEWAEHDIVVNALAPGFVRTGITDRTQDAAGYTDDDVRKRTPMARFGTLEEMAECATFLVSRDNYVTGEVLEADGGWTADAWRYWPERGE